MLTLTYGYKKPETGDRGVVFFPALEFDIQQLNDHNHDGINSAQLTAQSVISISQDLAAAGWVSTTGGMYRQLVTMLPGTLFDSYAFAFQVLTGPNAGKRLYLDAEKVTATSLYVYVNDNSIDVRLLYLV